MSTLYELTGELKELTSLDMPEDQVADTLEAIEGEFNDKAVNIVHVVHAWDSDLESIDAEIKRLTARKKAIKNKQESLKDYLRVNMEQTGINKIECPLFTISCVQGREIAAIDDQDALPDDCVTVKTTVAPDKNAIAAKLKAGEEVPGAHLERAKSSVRIK